MVSFVSDIARQVVSFRTGEWSEFFWGERWNAGIVHVELPIYVCAKSSHSIVERTVQLKLYGQALRVNGAEADF